MKKVILTYLVIKYIEKIYNDWIDEQLKLNEFQSLIQVFIQWTIKNLPILNKIYK